MGWQDWVPIGAGALYVVAAIGYLRTGQTGLALAYAAYAVACGALVLAAIQGR